MDRKKLIAVIVLICAGVGLGVGAVVFAANTLGNSLSGANPADALNVIPPIPPALKARLDWQPDGDLQREVEPATRTALADAYLRAWAQLNDSLRNDAPIGLETYFNGGALAGVVELLALTTEHPPLVFDITHNLTVDFYSADGQVVSFTDDLTIIRGFVEGVDMRDAVESEEQYQVVMLLQDGNWRIRHFVRQHAEIIEVVDVPGPTDADFSGINYYPQQTPFLDFWPAFDPAVVDADLATIREMGLDTIRIFVPFPTETLGVPEEADDGHGHGAAEDEADEEEVVGITEEEMAAMLVEVLDIAHSHDVDVVVTLFDFWVDYKIENWPFADRYLRTIVGTVDQHPALAAWDLKNEPDLDFASRGEGRVEAWLQHTLTLLDREDPTTPVTIGWASWQEAPRFADRVDFVTFHYYAPVAELGTIINRVRAEVGDKPIVIGEFGLPTWNTVLPNGHTEAEQAEYLAGVLQTARQHDVGTLVWTLYDFPTAPHAGFLPWNKGPELALGVVRPDGTKKPAASVLHPDAVLADVPKVGVISRFTKPFWLALPIFLLGVLGTIWAATKIWLGIRSERDVGGHYGV